MRSGIKNVQRMHKFTMETLPLLAQRRSMYSLVVETRFSQHRTGTPIFTLVTSASSCCRSVSRSTYFPLPAAKIRIHISWGWFNLGTGLKQRWRATSKNSHKFLRSSPAGLRTSELTSAIPDTGHASGEEHERGKHVEDGQNYMVCKA